MTPGISPLERIAIGIASLVLSIALIALLSGFFAGRDPGGVAGRAGVPGLAYPDLGHRHVAPGQRAGPYNSDPPTSGAHHPVAVSRDQTPISADALLQSLELGDVVVVYPPPHPPAGLRAALARLAPAFTPALAAAGQAIVLAPWPHVTGIVALAWAHLVRVATPADPRLRAFVGYWLGRGATASCC